MNTASLRVLGIDPGLTRCGFGVIDARPDRSVALVVVGVVRTDAAEPVAQRLRVIGDAIEAVVEEHRPAVLAIERVFAQQNLRTVMGVAQISGVLLAQAAGRGLPVALHTPTEVKAAVTGYGRADKAQVAAMVARLLGLAEAPKPADAADALALAICHAWRGALPSAAMRTSDTGRIAEGLAGGATTPAQRAWLAAERAAASAPAHRLGA